MATDVNRAKQSLGNYKHGFATKGSVDKVYKVWLSMRKRCANPKDASYHLYGGRGIAVCPAWDDFSRFVTDMGPRPDGYSLDRVDNSRGYEPSNCRWASPGEQARNTRRNVRIAINGDIRVAQDWALALGVSRQTIYNRIKKGVYRAL